MLPWPHVWWAHLRVCLWRAYYPRSSFLSFVSNKQECPRGKSSYSRCRCLTANGTSACKTQGSTLSGSEQVGSGLQRPADKLQEKKRRNSKEGLWNVPNISELLLTKTQGSPWGLSQPRNALMPPIPQLLLVYLAAFLCIMCIPNAQPSFKEFEGNPAEITLELSTLAKASVDSKAQLQSLQ